MALHDLATGTIAAATPSGASRALTVTLYREQASAPASVLDLVLMRPCSLEYGSGDGLGVGFLASSVEVDVLDGDDATGDALAALLAEVPASPSGGLRLRVEAPSSGGAPAIAWRGHVTPELTTRRLYPSVAPVPTIRLAARCGLADAASHAAVASAVTAAGGTVDMAGAIRLAGALTEAPEAAPLWIRLKARFADHRAQNAEDATPYDPRYAAEVRIRTAESAPLAEITPAVLALHLARLYRAPSGEWRAEEMAMSGAASSSADIDVTYFDGSTYTDAPAGAARTLALAADGVERSATLRPLMRAPVVSVAEAVGTGDPYDSGMVRDGTFEAWVLDADLPNAPIRLTTWETTGTVEQFGGATAGESSLHLPASATAAQRLGRVAAGALALRYAVTARRSATASLKLRLRLDPDDASGAQYAYAGAWSATPGYDTLAPATFGVWEDFGARVPAPALGGVLSVEMLADTAAVDVTRVRVQQEPVAVPTSGDPRPSTEYRQSIGTSGPDAVLTLPWRVGGVEVLIREGVASPIGDVYAPGMAVVRGATTYDDLPSFYAAARQAWEAAERIELALPFAIVTPDHRVTLGGADYAVASCRADLAACASTATLVRIPALLA